MKYILFAVLWLIAWGTSPKAADAQQSIYLYACTATNAVVYRFASASPNADIPAMIDGVPVTEIGPGAFQYTSVTNVTIPDSVLTIGLSAFRSCYGLKSVRLGANLSYIGNEAFIDCRQLANISIPDSVTNIGGSAFYGCKSLTNATLGKNLKSINTGIFRGCERLISINIPGKVELIDAFAFYGCKSLRSIIIPASVTQIEDNAFDGCDSMTEYVVDEANAYYSSSDGVLLNKQKSILHHCPMNKEGGYEIPDGVSAIGGEAFSHCGKLTQVSIPNSVLSIGDGSFSNCASLSRIAIPSGVKTINPFTFFGCSVLENVLLPNSITTIRENAFSYCSKLKAIVIPDGVISIASGTFSGCSSLEYVKLSDRIANIGGSAFSSCASLVNITFPDQLKSIGYGAFKNCTRLAGMTIPNSVKYIESSAFSGCTNMRHAIVGNGLERIGDRAFEQCPNLTGIYFSGDASVVLGGSFANNSRGLVIYYYPGTKGWSPTFFNHPTQEIASALSVLGDMVSGVVREGADVYIASQIFALPSPAYQWFFNGNPIAGATNDFLFIPSSSSMNEGDYFVIATNVAGVVTNGPVSWGVNNVTASNCVALTVKDTSMAMTLLSAKKVSGPWTVLANTNAGGDPLLYYDFDFSKSPGGFYKTLPAMGLESRILCGWTLANPSGSRVKIEFADRETGFNNWQLLTNLTLPASPYLFIDGSVGDKRTRYYRTTPMP